MRSRLSVRLQACGLPLLARAACVFLLSAAVCVATVSAQDATTPGPSTPPLGPAARGPFVPGAAAALPPTPEEYTAYTEAISQSPPAAQAEALQNFIDTYPHGLLALQARRALAQAAQKPPATVPLNPPAAPAPSPGAQAAANQAAKPAAVPYTPQQPARRAVIASTPHALTIRADNSSLVQIFRDVSASTGLKVEGLTRDERIYGTFGPGDPHDVLSALVDGLGYNFLMVGVSSNGAPRRLILSEQASVPSPAAPPKPFGASGADQEEEVMQDDQAAQPETAPGTAFVPPPQPGAPGPGANARTPEQMLEELRRAQTPEAGAVPEQPQ